MSVIMTMWIKGDPKQFENFAAANEETMRAVADRAKEHGLIAHRFYGGEGQILVVDEWPDAESFQRFFDDQRAEIEPMMQAAGAQGEPAVSFWTKLDSRDEVGWDS